MADVPEPADIFDRLVEVTSIVTDDKNHSMTIDFLYPRFKDGKSGGYDKSKSAFKEWMKHYINGAYEPTQVQYLNNHNKLFIRGVKFKPEAMETGGIELQQF